MSFDPTRRRFVETVIATAGLIGLSALGCARAEQPESNRGSAAEPRSSGVTSSGQAVGKPNVLLILADDLGWSDIGCYGSEISTPNIDALAGEGLRFTQFYNSARCCPSRAAILTGLNPHQAGVPDMGSPLNAECVTLPEVLKPAGYQTYMVGKWHLSEQVTPIMRGFDEFYGMLGGFNTYWQEDPYYTRLPVEHTKRPYAADAFYSTNVFGDYALDFLKQGHDSGKPWFMYLAFNAAHFPLGAPESAIEKYESLYRKKGWDAIRADRLAKQKKLGLVPQDLELTPRGTIPPNFINKRTGWADKEIPAWDSLPEDRRADLARRMAIYAAAIDIMDQNIGRVVAHLKETGEFDNTLIFFLSDNGACAEWDPFGFDKLDSTLNIIHKGEDLKKAGGPDSYISYGTGWANACDTPWRLYKHYAQEGGIRTPMIVHWPAGLKTNPGALTKQNGYITDFMPTVSQVCGATYPTEHKGVSILPEEGESLTPTFGGQDLKPRILCVEHEGNRMVREADWKLVALAGDSWELYDLSKDPAEMHDLAASQADRVKKMDADWNDWAVRCNVVRNPSPQIANQPLDIRCDVTPAVDGSSGVILAQGGNQRGYALYLQAGVPIFAVREAGKLYLAASKTAVTGHFTAQATLAKSGAMALLINGKQVATGKAPGLIAVQPQDDLSVGEDSQSPVGDYAAPNPMKGKVEHVHVRTGTGGAPAETSANSD